MRESRASIIYSHMIPSLSKLIMIMLSTRSFHIIATHSATMPLRLCVSVSLSRCNHCILSMPTCDGRRSDGEGGVIVGGDNDGVASGSRHRRTDGWRRRRKGAERRTDAGCRRERRRSGVTGATIVTHHRRAIKRKTTAARRHLNMGTRK